MIQLDFSKYKLEELIDLNKRIFDYVKAAQDEKMHKPLQILSLVIAFSLGQLPAKR